MMGSGLVDSYNNSGQPDSLVNEKEEKRIRLQELMAATHAFHMPQDLVSKVVWRMFISTISVVIKRPIPVRSSCPESGISVQSRGPCSSP